MYKLLIIDDEEIMRDGLSNLIDWKTMGFEVVGKLDDGRDGIEFIGNNPVDVILTDIKMTFVSGIELAKYVMVNNLNIKIVLISGFQEFELARQAIAYNVNHYLLKPPKFKDIQAVFNELKAILDTEKENRLLEQKRKEQYEELLFFSREQFFTDLFFGALSGEEEIKSRLRLMDFKIDAEKNPCIVFSIEIQSYESFLNNWDFGKDGLLRAIRNFFNSENNSLLFYPVKNTGGKIQMLCISQQQINISLFSDMLENFIETVRENSKKLLKLDFIYKNDFTFNNLLELAKRTDSDNFGLINQVKLMTTYLSSGNFMMSESLFENFLSKIKNLDMSMICNHVSSLFDMIYSKLEENGIRIEQSAVKKLHFNDLQLSNNFDQIKAWGKNELSNIVRNVEKEKSSSFENAIDRAKQYINKNYNRDITLEDLADHIFLNPVYFSRLFKEQTGENYIDYLIKVRMENAVKLLQDPSYKVHQISEKVGYNSLRYFYKIFKRYKGQTPTEYRKSLWGEDALI